MTAAELTFEILDRRKISIKEKDYWCCFEVNEKEETGKFSVVIGYILGYFVVYFIFI